MTVKRIFENRNNVYIIGFIFVALYYLPYIILGEDMFVYDHDFLDSHQAYMKVLKDKSALFDPNYVFPAMEGVPVSGFDSLYPFRCLIYYMFPPYYAMIIGDAVARFFAYIGMLLLLCRFATSKRDYIIATICSVLFGILYYHDGYFELGSAGIPLLIWCFLNLKDEKKTSLSYITIVFIASFSSIFHLAFFACILLFVYYLYMVKTTKLYYKPFFYGIVLLGLSSLVFSYNTIYNFLLSDITSHRVEFCGGLPLKESIRGIFSMALHTQEHTGILPTIIIIIYTFVTVIASKFKLPKAAWCICISISLILLFWGVYQYVKYLLPEVGIIHTFQADRFYFALPTLWIVLLFILFKDNNIYRRIIIPIITCLVFVHIVLANPEYRCLLRQTSSKNLMKTPTYRQFYDVNLFESIKTDIRGFEESKCVSLGFYPSILNYNGIYTLDGYFVSYPLEYKYKFRDIIAKELDKNEEILTYYDNWGSRCYMFSSELGKNYLYGKNNEIREVNNLEINTEALRDLGCAYIISAVKINNADQLNIEYVNTFTTPESFWELYVYKL